jgi:hypothetical protein
VFARLWEYMYLAGMSFRNISALSNFLDWSKYFPHLSDLFYS